MSSKLLDNHGRPINYIRLAVTDRCNLRCFYCMPEEGIKYLPRTELLSYEEMLRMLNVLAQLGIQKVRITGGEPFLRKNMMYFLEEVLKIEGIQKLNITTNGTLTTPLIPSLKKLGVHSINLSIDSLDQQRFYEITRRDELPKVLETLDALMAHNIPTKLNAVVMEGRNTEDIIPLAELTKELPISVRFIEEMPFNGTGANYPTLNWNYKKILDHLKATFPKIEKLKDAPHSTSLNYQVPGFTGSIGIIPAFSRTFCGTCNRIRVTPQGVLKTCLYDSGVFNIRDIMRSGATDEQLKTTFLEAIGNRAKDGYEAEQNRKLNLPVTESMSTIGG